MTDVSRLGHKPSTVNDLEGNPLELPPFPIVLAYPVTSELIQNLESLFDDCLELLGENGVSTQNATAHQERVVGMAQTLEAAARLLSHDLRAHVLAEENYHTPTDEAGEAQRRADLDLLLAGGPQW